MIEILPFTPEDQEETVTFMQSIYKEMGWPEQSANGLTDLATFFHLPDGGAFFMIKEQGKIVGTGGYVKLIDGSILLKRFYIDKKLRGSGIAHDFWNKLVESMKSLDASRVVLDVNTKNLRAIRFYEKIGFIQYDQEPIEGWKESYHPETQAFYYLKI